MAASEHYDGLETRDPGERERDLLARLARQVAHARARAPGFARILNDVDPRALGSRAALARLPVTRKSDLKELQANAPPLGG
ncbi:MAG: phenylacetate--CoA ligase family protein, partial [Burkholderiales bacterium]